MRATYQIAEPCCSVFALTVARMVQRDMESPERRREFERWYEKHFGVPYVWGEEGAE